ncbi:DUF4280 domain-containing protein [Candidatus Uabimicrobium amorphum]|uniref:DUF4280 domain-containing protein n=1 Tax=Uabimicrobium amorphum TaxID=2596890 RepID=A0A5S9ISD6_UABAM|nr:DUF4280 domain-containing protein [Candidatus Uabimicrobium amorphum]BBM86661.1 hypothetical protein UABAM_05047 [Candidatus Uabimicrobium amorphum]
MAQQTCMGATLQCSFGVSVSSLIVARTVFTTTPAANIMDHKPFSNILPFGLCTSIANPQVASATAAALGVLTPMPCIPATSFPWLPLKPTITIDKFPTLDKDSVLLCQWLGVIRILNPGQMITMLK